MKSFIIFVVLILTLSLDLMGQGDHYNKFSISISSGGAIPVGSYANMDIINSAIFTPENVQNPWVIGIDKSKSGFAELGHFVNLGLNYNLSQSIDLNLQMGYSSNSVSTDGITQFLTTNFGNQKFEHDDYKIFHVAPGLGYKIMIGSFNFVVGVHSGLAITNYPYYQSILLFTTTDPPQIWAHDGDRSSLKALFIGTSININYQFSPKINLGVDLAYQSSNFEYSMRTRVIPGVSPNPEISDVLKASILNIGFKLQYNFTRKQ